MCLLVRSFRRLGSESNCHRTHSLDSFSDILGRTADRSSPSCTRSICLHESTHLLGWIHNSLGIFSCTRGHDGHHHMPGTHRVRWSPRVSLSDPARGHFGCMSMAHCNFHLSRTHTDTFFGTLQITSVAPFEFVFAFAAQVLKPTSVLTNASI